MECERGLQAISESSEMGIVIIRPPLVYGREVGGNFSSLLNLTKTRLPLPLGGILNKRSLVFVKNLVNLIIHVIDHPNAIGQIFLVSDGRDVSTTRLIEIIYAESGKKAKLFKVPQILLKFLLNLIGREGVYNRLFGNLQLDITYTKEKLGWTPPYSLEDGISEAIKGS